MMIIVFIQGKIKDHAYVVRHTCELCIQGSAHFFMHKLVRFNTTTTTVLTVHT